MKRAYLLLVMLFILSACDQVNTRTTSQNNDVVVEDANVRETVDNGASGVINGIISKDTSDFLAEDESNLSAWDFETAYKMCSEALLDYYKAIWNGSDIDLDTYIHNDNLRQYTQKKITSQYDLYRKNKLTHNLVEGIDVGARKVEYVDGDNSFLYIKFDVRVKKDVGSYAEPAQFLVQNLNGKLVIADWYHSGKDSYDSIVRGENQVIDNPDIWND